MTQKRYLDNSIKQYLDDLAAKLPAPGGGSAAALSSALGVSLLCMTANYTVGKKGYEEHQNRISDILNRLTTIKNRLSQLIDLDVEAYQKVRDQKNQKAFIEAMAVPLEILQLSLDTIKYAEELAKIGNKNLISDVGCAVAMLKSGIESARFNVVINLESIEDKKFVDDKESSINSSISKFEIAADKVLAEVRNLMS